MFKLYAKFDQNRTMRCRAIDDLAHYRREIVEGVAFNERISGVRGPNFTKLGEDIRSSSVLTKFVLELRYLAPFFNAASLKLSDVENEAKIRTFDPCKN